MYTGIVQATGAVAHSERTAFGQRMVVDCSRWIPVGGYVPARGDSICVSGVCLTIAELMQDALTFDVVAETLGRTTLGQLVAGDTVNLEPSVTASQPLGGHFMQGHVDGVGEVIGVCDDDPRRLTIRPPADLLDTVVPKGSIAVDGVSLTIAAVIDDAFEVALIPTTIDCTTLGTLLAGDQVNLESDIIARTVVHVLKRGKEGPVTMDLLRDAGFVE